MIHKLIPRTTHPVLRSRREVAQHYLGDLIYGANDGIVTTFAVVAGVAGARLSIAVVLILGLSNLLADGFSMAASNYLAIRSRSSAEFENNGSISEPYAVRHGVATFVAFVIAGSFPLLAYLIPFAGPHHFSVAAWVAALALFTIGASRSLVASGSWWKNGLEMLTIGGTAGMVSYFVGVLVSRWIGSAA